MALTKLEERLLREIHEWENQLARYEPNDFQLTFEKYFEQSFSMLPDEIQQQFFSAIDNWLFHLHAMIQGSQLQANEKERILSAAQVFNPSIETIKDLKTLELNQLQYIAQQQIARHRFYSFAQGGLSGSGSSALLGMDIPAMAVINLRAIQLIAMSFGFEPNTPYEMMTSLKIFHAATVPKRMQHAAWKEIIADFHVGPEPYFYEGSEAIIEAAWMEQPLQQMLKAMVIYLFRQKTVQGIPMLSIAIGAGMNYRFTKKTTTFAHHYYLLRFMQEKEESFDEYSRT
ncbi:EcsC family protein [Neobacillus sp. SM06]|uniref:EcsC family protein n=1 Tax=Neobacillus sp. SM06 TaxID=3422492 RepID=UPI003D2CD18E